MPSQRYVETHREHVAEYNKRWKAENRERVSRAVERYRKRHPEKARAKQAVTNAVRRGKLVKPERCEDCGDPTPKRQIHGHHEDYSKPLEVNWLCRGCHTKRHVLEADRG